MIAASRLKAEVIAPDIASARRVLIAAHGNSLRALVKSLNDIPEGEIVELSMRGGRAAGCGLGRRCCGSRRCHQLVDRAAQVVEVDGLEQVVVGAEFGP